MKIFPKFSKKAKRESIDNYHAVAMQKTQGLFIDSTKSIILPKFVTNCQCFDSDLV